MWCTILNISNSRDAISSDDDSNSGDANNSRKNINSRHASKWRITEKVANRRIAINSRGYQQQLDSRDSNSSKSSTET
jgi:hypothetical protein